ncbi:MAG: phosphatidylserine decarboxylase [Acidobacteria bacterium]|nr:MAG: phosphatidylserine decarboxylase [Acidobacteriota bacterium]REK01846.1 MAG: phosphatidylserine decarboxylase [Acidobacteriota bacterium]REK14802.1 MAG: phosphatidylserine decarboxylase [Acidobacteriota bacterium]REK45517.1 MAG: phosphatidylserine decarboxylase [Acidobacteriota bacterium]
MVKDGIPFVALPLIVSIAFAYFGYWIVAVPLFALAAFMVFFFRNPSRSIPDEPNIVVSAADGKVTRIEETEDGMLVSVFLSPLDVHVNRSPIAGEVISIKRFKGKKRPATSNEASSTNERNQLTIKGQSITVVCTQIVGIMARRIVCWPKEGDRLDRGQLFGLIRFGSRTDLLLPAHVSINVEVGDRVRGGETIIAKY